MDGHQGIEHIVRESQHRYRTDLYPPDVMHLIGRGWLMKRPVTRARRHPG